MAWPRRITRYLLAELTGPTLLGLFLYTFVLLMNHFFLVAEKALAKSLGLELTARLFLHGIPNLLVLAIPMSVLLGTLIAVGRLSADHEWIALQGAGQGPSRLFWPVATFGLGASLLGFSLYAAVVPLSNYELRNLRGEVMFKSNLASDLKPRVFYTNVPDVVLYVDDIRAGTEGRLDGVLLVETDPERGETQLILADAGDLYPAADRSGALVLDLTDGIAHVYDLLDPEAYRVPRFEFLRKTLAPAEFLAQFLERPEKVVTDLTFPELLDETRRARDELRTARAEPSAPGNLPILEHRYRRDTIEVHQRMAIPLASFFFAILGMPLGITRVRSGKGAGFAMSVLVIMVYWVAFTVARDQAVAGKIPAALGPWVGNILMVPWAAFALWRLRFPAGGGMTGLIRDVAGAVVRRARSGLRVLAPRRPLPPPDPADDEADLAPLTGLGGTPARFVGRIDVYVGLRFLQVLAFAVITVYLLYALVETRNLMDGLLRTQQSPTLLLRFFKYSAPGVLNIVLPISCLVGAVITFTLFSRTGELTAIKATGISMRRVVVSVLVLTTILCAMLFLVQDRIAPVTTRRAEAVKDQIKGRTARTYGPVSAGRWSFGPAGSDRLYNYGVYDPAEMTFQGLNVFTINRDPPEIRGHMFAHEARWTVQGWEMDHGWVREFPSRNGDGGSVFERFDEPRTVQLDPPRSFANRIRGAGKVGDLPDQLSFEELTSQIDTLGRSGYDVTHLRVALHGKFARAISPLVMVALGLPFAFQVGRRGSLYGVGVALLLVLVYWAVFATFNALGMETILEPWIAAWAPNVLFGLVGAYLMLYVRT